jgi:arsenical pump membrane protein
MEGSAILALLIFVLTVTLVIWRPKGIHEMIPAVMGGLATLALGLTGMSDVHRILVIVSNAALTIISTFVMSSVLDHVGFFRWTALNLAQRAGGDGVRLWVYVLLLSIGMTLFLNNDGSILIATPIICELTKRLGLDRRHTTPFILGSALVATASSAPIGVSNPANLEAMALAGFDLITHTEYMFLPSVLGLSACLFLLWLRFRRDIPATYMVDALDDAFPVNVHPPHPHHPHRLHPPMPPHLSPPHRPPHEAGAGRHEPVPPPPGPLGRRPEHKPPGKPVHLGAGLIKDVPLLRLTVAVVVSVRLGFFLASLYHIPTSVVALFGALVVVLASAYRRSVRIPTVLAESPWHILAFAFGMELVVFGLRNTGLIGALGEMVAPLLRTHLWALVVLPGTGVGLLAAVMNNHPALIAGTLTLTGLGLDFVPLKLAYTGVVLGSDILSLLTPMGTLASLLWFHLIHRQGMRFTWGEYMATSLRVIPLSFAASLVGLYLWALIVR